MTGEEFKSQLGMLRTSTRQRPGDWRTWAALGDFLRDEAENRASAIRAYQKALELSPQNRPLELQLGHEYARLPGGFHKGVAIMQAAIQADPSIGAYGYCFLSDVYWCNDQRTEAEEYARKAVELEPGYEEAHYMLGEALVDRDAAGAIQAFRKAVELDPRYAMAWQSLGRELSNAGLMEDALIALKTSVALDSDNVWSHLFLAAALWKCGMLDEADSTYRAAIVAAPEFDDARKWYQEFLDAEKPKRDANPSTR